MTEPLPVGQQIGIKARTEDIKLTEDLTFHDLFLSPRVLEGLQAAGFHRPSPIQVKAIPLGRCGLDLIVQAKSGTGKTCVFSVIVLEHVVVETNALQALVLSPTREIAVQSQSVIKRIGASIEGLQCHTFIGGINLSEDLQLIKNCHIAVGSPGRIKYLIESGYLKTGSIRMLVIDEADMLFTENFQPTINWIYSSLPSNKQVLTLSATYTPNMIQHLTMYMKSPQFVRLNAVDPALLGIKQFFVKVPFDPSPHTVFQSKAAILFKLLASVEFQQCLIFSNFHSSAQELCETLIENGWPTAYIAGSLSQADRLQAYDKLKRFHCRVLVSTDLTSRGIDAENVNLVVNMEVPWEHETYLHRIGRAGRFGSYGAAVSLVSDGAELTLLRKVQDNCNTRIHHLPDPIPVDLTRSDCQINLDDLVTTEQLLPVKPRSKRFKAPRSAMWALPTVPASTETTTSDFKEEKDPDYEGNKVDLKEELSSSALNQETHPTDISESPLDTDNTQKNGRHTRTRITKRSKVSKSLESTNQEMGALIDRMWTSTVDEKEFNSAKGISTNTILSQLENYKKTKELPFSSATTAPPESTFSETDRTTLIDLINQQRLLPQPALDSLSLSSTSSELDDASSPSESPVNMFHLTVHRKEIGIQTRNNWIVPPPCPPGEDEELLQLREELDSSYAWAEHFAAQYGYYNSLVETTEAEIAELLQES